MHQRSPAIPARYFRLVIAYAESLGFARDRVLTAAGLQDARLEDGDISFTVDQFDAALGAVARLSDRSDTGFEVGRRMTFDQHGALGLAIPRCANADEAIAMVSRYYPLVTPSFAMGYRRDAKRGVVTYRPLVGMSREALRAIAEMHVVSFHCILTAAVQRRLPPYDIYMPFEAPPHAARYRELSPARVHFGRLPMPEVRMEFDATLMDLPMAQSDPGYVSRAIGDLESRRSRVADGAYWSDWVTLILEEAEDCQPTLAQIGEVVGIGRRTLARRLAQEGANFRSLANLVRHRRACRLLRDTRTPVSQIAFRLGYSDAGNFSSAFRRAAGVSPRRFRESQVPGQAPD
jgi:AraC-like DNA-binding protein